MSPLILSGESDGACFVFNIFSTNIRPKPNLVEIMLNDRIKYYFNSTLFFQQITCYVIIAFLNTYERIY